MQAQKRINIILANPDMRYDNILRETEVENLAAVLCDDNKDLNMIQNQSGFEDTPFLREEIKFSKCYTCRIVLVWAELHHRRIPFTNKEK